MEQLIPVIENDGEVLVNGRNLHEFLEVNSNYTTWFDRMTGYGFEENTDYILLSNFGNQTGRGGHNKYEHHLKLDMAKEVAMIQRTDKGKKARKYFIDIEKKFKDQQIDISKLSPELQMFDRMFKTLAMQQLKQQKLESKVDGMKDLLSLDVENWRLWATKYVRKIAIKRGGLDQFKETASESYKLLELKAHCNLDIRLSNRKKNMIAQGLGKTAVGQLNKLDVIAEDHRLKEIYISIIREMAFKNDVWDK